MSQSATPAAQNYMTTSCDSLEKTSFEASPKDTATLPSQRPCTHTHTALLKHMQGRKVPVCHAKQHHNFFLARLKRHVFAASSIDRAALVPQRRRTRTHTCLLKHMECIGISQSARPATRNDIASSCDTLGKTSFCSFPHRQGNFIATTACADCCGHLWTPKRRQAKTSQTPGPSM